MAEPIVRLVSEPSFDPVTCGPLYGRPCRSPDCWMVVGERPSTGPNLVRDTSEKVDLIRKNFSWLRAGRRVIPTDGDNL